MVLFHGYAKRFLGLLWLVILASAIWTPGTVKAQVPVTLESFSHHWFAAQAQRVQFESQGSGTLSILIDARARTATLKRAAQPDGVLRFERITNGAAEFSGTTNRGTTKLRCGPIEPVRSGAAVESVFCVIDWGGGTPTQNRYYRFPGRT